MLPQTGPCGYKPYECLHSVSIAHILHKVILELKVMIDQYITDDFLHIAKNDSKPCSLSDQTLPTCSAHPMKNTHTLAKMSVEYEGLLMVTIPSKICKTNDHSQDQPDFNATKDIVSPKPVQFLESLYTIYETAKQGLNSILA